MPDRPQLRATSTGLPTRSPSGALHPAVDPDWFRDHENLALLARWLRDRDPLTDLVELLDAPWHWQREWEQMWMEEEN